MEDCLLTAGGRGRPMLQWGHDQLIVEASEAAAGGNARGGFNGATIS